MSTRALRKLREQEWDKQLAASRSEEELEDEEEDEPVVISKPKNAFDMLNAIDNEDDDDNDEDFENITASSTQIKPPQSTSPTRSSTPRSNKKKKKKPKKKQKDKSETPQNEESNQASEDDIDKALKELDLKQPSAQNGEDVEPQNLWEREAIKHLAVETKNLDPVNEMRSLFGNIALEDDARSRSQQNRRRDQNQQGGVDLETALTGRYNRASQGKELSTLAKRRNCFMQGKEQWPLATSGGLSMEVLPTTSFEKHYNLMHNQLYKSAQWDFDMAVESMQAEAMIGMLQKHPYHLASLLQVSEIAKHQGDSSLSGDLLERSLFTLGRSVHSSFPSAIRDGIARLDFNKPANRELYLTIWRYIRNLEQRGTWKTAFEWSKLLLQLNTTSDPFGVTLMIDQLALRGRQHQQFLDLISESAYGPAWSHLPNICISKSLALLRAQKPREARQQLAVAMHRYPFILSALASAIEVSPIPKSIWGKLPSTDAEKLYSELYVTRARDLWNTPETIGLISEVANTIQYYKSFIDSSPPAPALQISLEEARHVLALEIPSIIAFLPRQFTAMSSSSTDVLPPPSTESNDLIRRAPTDAPVEGSGPGLVAIGGDMVSRALRWFFTPAGAGNVTEETTRSQEENLRALRQELGPEAANIPDEVLQQMMEIRIAQDFGELDDEDLEQIAVAGPMAGGWNYYDSPAVANRVQGDNASETESMPDLESVGTPAEQDLEGPATAQHRTDHVVPVISRGPHAVTVEEEDEEEQESHPQQAALQSHSGAILRHIDSDDEDAPSTRETVLRSRSTDAQQQPHSLPRPQNITQSHNPTTSIPVASATDEEIESNPQRLQRWLIGTGLEELKVNPNMSTYIRRLKMLHRNQQVWILNMLKQRGDAETSKRIEQAL